MVAFLAGVVLVAAGSDEPRRTCYQIDVRVTAVRLGASRAEQRVRVVAEPRIITLSGRPAFFRAGGTQLVLDGLAGPGVVQQTTGFEIQVTAVEQSHHRVRVETEIRLVEAKRGQRTILEAASGTKQRFRVTDPNGHDSLWVEVTVTEKSPDEAR